MNPQDLHALADLEIQVGLFDRDLMQRAEAEAAGKAYLVHENYWRLRANSLAAEANKAFPSNPDAYIEQIRAKMGRPPKEIGTYLSLQSLGLDVWQFRVRCDGRRGHLFREGRVEKRE